MVAQSDCFTCAPRWLVSRGVVSGRNDTSMGASVI